MTRNREIPHISQEDQAFVRGLLVHEDDNILVFNKPSGLPSQSRGNRARNLDHLLWTFARSNGKRPHLVHRIDAGTSGLIVAAKTKPANAHLGEAFATRRVRKTYVALVGGEIPAKTSGRITTPLASAELAGRERILAVNSDTDGAKRAATRWRVLSRTETHAALELNPETGRTHQIRVHLASMGCPILGDSNYGHGPLTAPRLMLHAAALSLKDDDMALDLSVNPALDMTDHAASLGLSI